MARQVRFRSSLAVALAVVLYSCTHKPLLKVPMGDAGLRQRGELLFYHDEPFTGADYELFPTGDTARYTEYKDGKQNGVLKWWYPNRQLAQLRFFADGKKVGMHRGWWEDGSLKFEYHFVDDEHEGAAKEWFMNGKLFRLFHYKNGHEEGSEKMWWADGKIRANYVIINGEKFGLFGQKLCVNDLKK